MAEESSTKKPITAPGHRADAVSIGRHPRDLTLVLFAAVVVALSSLVPLAGEVNPVEVAIYRQLQRLPEASTIVWQIFALLGDWAGIAAVSAVALYARRIRLGLLCAVTGTVSLLLADIVARLVGHRAVPAAVLDSTDNLRLPGAAGFAFPSPHTAVAAALVAVAVPYLRRRYRGPAWAVVVLVGASDVYLGNHLPLGAFAGVFLGWGVSAVFHLALGAPGRRTTETAVARALARAGLTPVDVVCVRDRLTGPVEFVVTTADGDRLRVEAVRRMRRRAGAGYRLRRLLASLDVEDEPPLSSAYHETEHEALVTLFAQRAGLRTPPVVLICEADHGTPLLVRRQIEGRRLTELSRDELDESLLDAIWGQVATLADARIGHQDMRARNILVDTQGQPWLLNLTFGKIGATAHRTAQDIAETLVSLASLVGVTRAVRSASRALPPDQLEPALELLQPLALPRRIRAQIKPQRYVLTDLRETLSEQIDRPIPAFRSPVRPRTLIGLLLLGAAVYVLLPQLSSMAEVLDALSGANWGWLAVAIATGLLATVLVAVSIMGSSPTSLPFWRTAAVELAGAFTGRTTPGAIGFFGINIAYLERIGLRRSRAVGVVILNRAATAVVAGLWTVTGMVWVGASSGVLGGVTIPRGWPIPVAVGVALALAAVLASPFGRRTIVRPGLDVARELIAVFRQPVRAIQLLGGTAGFLALSGFGLVATLAAFDRPVPVVAVLTVYVVGQTLGHLAPVPGGLGAVETLMVAGLTAMEVAPTAAVTAVLTMRVLTYWLPVLPGIAMFRYLQHHGIV